MSSARPDRLQPRPAASVFQSGWILTKGEQIIAAPTLIKKLPLPMRRIIGDMSNHERVLLGLDLVPTRPRSGGGKGVDDDREPI
jgi:hypothetical protein